MPHPESGLTASLHPEAAGPHLLSVTGELDYHTAPRLREVLGDVPLGPGTALVMDLSGLEYCDSSGIQILVSTYQRARDAGAALALAGVDPHIRHTLRAVGLEQIFSFFDSAEDAIGKLARQPSSAATASPGGTGSAHDDGGLEAGAGQGQDR